MKKCIILTLFLFAFLHSNAAHLKGGWIQYEYLGDGSAVNSSRYRITVRQYLACNSRGDQRDADINLGIFNTATGVLVGNMHTIPLTGTETQRNDNKDPCITGDVDVCFIVDRYVKDIELPNIDAGYTLAVQRCCRIAGIVNVGASSSDIGVTYSNTIPGIINGENYAKNSSPVFAQKDAVLICFKAPFKFDFSASDADGDRIEYIFCEGLVGGTSSNTSGPGTGPKPNPPSGPAYANVPYRFPFNGSNPMSGTVTINPTTGLITGIAPNFTGDYIVAVCAMEYRNNVLIGTTRKEIHIKVADCSLSAAALKPSYITCDGFTLSFQNESTASVNSYLWDFGVTNSVTDISTDPTPTFTYKDTGIYQLKLKVTNTGGCQDSATAPVRIFPGFKPNFSVTGTCFLNNYQFKDLTQTAYGVVDSWKWNFGDPSSIADTAKSKDSTWKYPNPVATTVKLVVTNSKGCIDSISKPFIVRDKPSLNLAFKDTLICSIDTLPLIANIVSGTINWTVSNLPNRSRILNANTPNPLVFPRDTTKYFITVNDNGCINTDTVTVNVLQFINVALGADSTICTTDIIKLKPITDALSFKWTASSGELVSSIKFPSVKPLSNTVYYLTANLGYCQARDSIRINTAPYPKVNIGIDTSICFGSRIVLQGSMIASSFRWSPPNSLVNTNSLNPIAGPSKTNRYILTVSDTLGCPKSVSDTVLVTVVPAILVNAGKDTAVLPNQPLQLLAAGNINGSYSWLPITGLNNTNTANPIAILNEQVDSIIYKVRLAAEGGCYGEDEIKVRVFTTGPDILVPSGFTPNGDGKNDLLKPFTVGINKINYFQVYNRWGELVFATTQLGVGWDGSYNNKPQASGTYVFQVEGVDYLGKKVYKKGTSVLIR